LQLSVTVVQILISSLHVADSCKMHLSSCSAIVR
jgi:hypothetical protein